MHPRPTLVHLLVALAPLAVGSASLAHLVLGTARPGGPLPTGPAGAGNFVILPEPGNEPCPLRAEPSARPTSRDALEARRPLASPGASPAAAGGLAEHAHLAVVAGPEPFGCPTGSVGAIAPAAAGPAQAVRPPPTVPPGFVGLADP